DMPFAGGPQAEDESTRPGGQARLVGVPDHRGIEQGRRLQRVFLGEVGADQQAPALADRLVGQQVFPDLLEAVQEELAGPLVPLAELPHHRLQQALDLTLGEGRDARDDLLDPALARHLERPDDDAGVGRPEDDPGALDVHVGDFRPRRVELRPFPGDVGHYRAWRNAARELSSRLVSARERRKARVDSAPWFRLIRPSWRPSQHPPVLGSYNSRPRSLRPRNHSKAERASCNQAGSWVARYASRQAETVALASIGCWSNRA